MADNIQKSDQPVEIEGKWHLSRDMGRENLKVDLEKAGAVFQSSGYELDCFFDDKNNELRNNKVSIRLRSKTEEEPRTILTYKGKPVYTSGLKERVELEVYIDNIHIMKQIFYELGFSITLEYKKYRDTWSLLGTVVTIDDLPCGLFCEIEGNREAVRRVAKVLGLTLDQVELRGYPELMRDYLGLS